MSTLALSTTLIDQAVRTDPLVHDCLIREEWNEKGDCELIVYIVPLKTHFSSREWSTRLKDLLKEVAIPYNIVLLASLPTGEELSAVLDEDLALRWKEMLLNDAHVEEAIVLIEQTENSPQIQKPEIRQGKMSVSATTREKNKPAYYEGGELPPDVQIPPTLAAALRRAAEGSHEIVYLEPDGSEIVQTYVQLIERAERILGGLRAFDLKPQDRVILQIESNHDYLPAFWACILGGFVPVPISIAPSYEEFNIIITKLHKAWEMTGQPLVLSSAHLAPPLRSLAHQAGLQNFRVETVEDLNKFARDQTWHESKPDDLTFLLFTSGSTGQPKGVMLSHRNILSMAAGFAHLEKLTREEITFNWMPLDHVGGLVTFHLRDVYLGCRQVHTSTRHILENPLKWLDYLERFQATMTWAPNFAYSLITDREEEIKKGKWDLSRLHYILNAGEAIMPGTARRFLKILAPSGLRPTAIHPSWGMSETSSGVTFSSSFSLATTSDDDQFVDVGPLIPGVFVRVVDSENNLLFEKESGRVQVKGPSVTSGYFDNPELNEEIFTTDGWFDTGDLGYLEDGHLTITGRAKNIIIVNGLNYYSHEIEAVVEEIKGIEVSYTAACAVRDAGSDTDKLAIFFHSAGGEKKALIKEIRARVVRAVGLNPHYIIAVEKEVIPKTQTGKIQRTQLKARFEAGEFLAHLQESTPLEKLVAYYTGSPLNNAPEPVDRFGRKAEGTLIHLVALPRTPEGEIDRDALVEMRQTDLEKRLSLIWQKVLTVPVVRPEDNFFELGGNSLVIARLISRVRDEFKVELATSDLFRAPTLKSLALLIEQSRKTETFGPLLSANLREGVEELPLSYAQARLWFLDQLTPGSSSYNVSEAFLLKGKLDRQALSLALEEIYQRHETLRTSFGDNEGHPFLKISPSDRFTLQIIEPTTEEARRNLEVYAREEAGKPFDLSTGPLFRAVLVRLSEEENLLLLTIHHIISDGWSMGLLFREISLLYSGQDKTLLPELPVQYTDFAIWQRLWLAGNRLTNQVDYWRKQLTGAISTIALPYDHPRPPVQTARGATFSAIIIEPADLGEIKAFVQEEEATLFMLLLGVFQTLLYRYSAQEDICVGTMIANRTQVAIEPLIGFFANTIVMRTSLAGEPSFRELIGRVKEMTLGAFAHQDLPFEQLVDIMQPKRELNRLPLFEIMFILQNADLPPLELKGLALEPLKIDNGTAKFDLNISMFDTVEGLRMSVEYKTDLFEKSTIERMLGHYRALLKEGVAHPDTPVSLLPILTPEEKEKILYTWNDTFVPAYLRRSSLHSLFEKQVLATPQAVALSFEDNELTYLELNRRSNSLARRLIALGAGPETLVGVCLERSLEMVVALLAILKAGAAYVPFDPTYPRERLNFMIQDSATEIILSQRHLHSLFAANDSDIKTALRTNAPSVIFLDSEASFYSRGRSTEFEDKGTQQETNRNPQVPIAPTTTAYMIYTSGSTGQPKGVLNTHEAIVNRLLWMQGAYQLTPKDHVLQKTPFSFDVSVWEFFWPLITGAHLVIARPGGHQDSQYLVNLIKEKEISTLHFVPSMLRIFLEEEGAKECRSLRQVICSGEALPFELTERFFTLFDNRRTVLYNLYGPTEAAVDVSFWTCQPGSSEHVVPIGRPIANINLYILDKQMAPVPVGVAGELHIGGIGLARGYHHRPELTAEKFVSSPFGPGRVYKTGDLARFREDGAIEYLGRIDHQVKIRGLRIELGEIEDALSNFEKIRDCVVVAREEQNGEKRLVAYIVPGEEKGPDIEELRKYLKEKIPEYMIPSAFVTLKELPLSPNGKVDRKALPAPEEGRPDLGNEFVEARNALEELLVETWKGVLKIERTGIFDNFFSVGGNSLMATQLASRLSKLLQMKVPVKTIFEAPTVESLAKSLIAGESVRGRTEKVAELRMKVAAMSREQTHQELISRS